MSVLHQPAYNFVQGTLVGYVKLLGIMRTFFGSVSRISSDGSTGTAADLGNAQMKYFLTNLFILSGGNDHSGIRNRKTNAGNDLLKDLIGNTVVELIRIDIIGTFQSRYGNGMRSDTVNGFQMLCMH